MKEHGMLSYSNEPPSITPLEPSEHVKELTKTILEQNNKILEMNRRLITVLTTSHYLVPKKDDP